MATDEVPAGLWLIGIGPGDLEHMTERAQECGTGVQKEVLGGIHRSSAHGAGGPSESVVGPWER